YGAAGVVFKFHRILLRLNTTPSARGLDASRLFLDRAATPPRRGGENSPRHHLATAPSARVWVLENVGVIRTRTRAEARHYIFGQRKGLRHAVAVRSRICDPRPGLRSDSLNV